MKKKVLLLDIDDTICNSSEAYKKALHKTYLFLKKKYPLISEELFFKVFRKAREEIHLELEGQASMHNRFLYFQRMFEIFGLTLEPKMLIDLDTLFWEETLKNLKPYKNLKKTLRVLKENNIIIGVVTDLTAQIQVKKLEKLGVASM